jgi:23S rRNA pseudouridine2605 synthase
MDRGKRSSRRSTKGANGSGGKRARISLARALSKLGYTSRSRAYPLIQGGQVAVNDQTVTNPEQRIDIERDRITVKGNAVSLDSYLYLMLHKPAGVVTTARDERGRATVFDLLDPSLPHLGAVGRLDQESEGLLLLTNDTRWANRITAPESHVDKVYRVQIDRVPDVTMLDALLEGVVDRGDRLRAKRVEPIRLSASDAWLEIVLEEGKNRHIRRMLAALGVGVQRLMRVQIGSLQLGKLPPGQYRALTATEVKSLTP